MVATGYPGGMMLVYGVAIGGAVARGTATIEELLALRAHAKAIVDAQGDLTSALATLDYEIAARGGTAGAKSAPPTAETRFIIQVLGLPIPPASRQRIEQVIGETVMAAIARHDSGGDRVATPLSQIKAFGAGLGGATAGIWIRPGDERQA